MQAPLLDGSDWQNIVLSSSQHPFFLDVFLITHHTSILSTEEHNSKHSTRLHTHSLSLFAGVTVMGLWDFCDSQPLNAAVHYHPSHWWIKEWRQSDHLIHSPRAEWWIQRKTGSILGCRGMPTWMPCCLLYHHVFSLPTEIPIFLSHTSPYSARAPCDSSVRHTVHVPLPLKS